MATYIVARIIPSAIEPSPASANKKGESLAAPPKTIVIAPPYTKSLEDAASAECQKFLICHPPYNPCQNPSRESAKSKKQTKYKNASTESFSHFSIFSPTSAVRVCNLRCRESDLPNKCPRKAAFRFRELLWKSDSRHRKLHPRTAEVGEKM